MSKSIGIITFHRAYNFGSILQAYALNSYLNSNGFEAKTIDFRTEKQDNIYKIFEKIHGPMSVVRNTFSLIHYRDEILHKRKFDEFIQERIPLTEKTYYNFADLHELEDQYDYFVCGSDQIWNPYVTDFDYAYLLEFILDKSKCVAYAPSIAVNSIDRSYFKRFREDLKDFRALSVRENSGADLLSEIVGRPVDTSIDPVFLLSKENWENILRSNQRRGKYIFCYFIGDVPNMRKFAISLGKKMKLPLIVIYKSIRDLGYRNIKEYDSGPAEFLGLIRDSVCVVTNSFHAVAFSLIFKKHFLVFPYMHIQSSAKNRIVDLLTILDMKDHIIDEKSVPNINRYVNMIYNDLIYDYHKLDDMIKRSKNYLFENLGDKNEKSM